MRLPIFKLLSQLHSNNGPWKKLNMVPCFCTSKFSFWKNNQRGNLTLFCIDISNVINNDCFKFYLTDKIRYLTMTDSTKVWMPDTFFRNEKIGRFHNILQPNLYVRVYPNGDVLYSIRVSLTCACSMHLALFPLDKQTCNLDVASCKYQFFI